MIHRESSEDYLEQNQVNVNKEILNIFQKYKKPFMDLNAKGDVFYLDLNELK